MEFRQTERIRPGGLSDRPQEQTRRRFSRRGIRARGAHGLATCGSAVEGAGSDGRWTGTGQDRQVESVTVGSGKNRAVLSALFARYCGGGKRGCVRESLDVRRNSLRGKEICAQDSQAQTLRPAWGCDSSSMTWGHDREFRRHRIYG